MECFIMTFAISWSDCILVRVREFVWAWAEISEDKGRGERSGVVVSRASRSWPLTSRSTRCMQLNQRGFPSVDNTRRKSRENAVFHCAQRTGSPRLYVTTLVTSSTGCAIKISTFCSLLLLYFMETLLSQACISR